jgi:hypothetical protein
MVGRPDVMDEKCFEFMVWTVGHETVGGTIGSYIISGMEKNF